MKLKLFQIAALLHPVDSDIDKDSISNTEIIIEPKFILAKDQDTAAKKVLRSIDAKYDDRLDNIEILIRPF